MRAKPSDASPPIKTAMLSKLTAKGHLRNVAMVALVCAFSLRGCPGENARAPSFVLQPLGDADERLLALMRRFVEAAYGAPCNVAPPLALPSGAYDRIRNQYQADRLLSFLQDNAPRRARKVVAVTEKDIYTRNMNFIFGLANYHGTFCVVSVARLRESFWGKPENQKLLYRRAFKVLYHELGHTFGMSHCDKIQCAMCYHNSLPELDASYVWFCPACTRKLEKLAGPFPEDRNEKLPDLLTEIGLTEDAKRYTQQKGGKE
jgi:archaemetzincin